MRFYDEQILLFKLEATSGVDANPTPAADAFPVQNLKVELQADTNTRQPNKPFFTNEEVSYVKKRYSISFDIPVFYDKDGGGIPYIDPIFKAAKYVGTVSGATYRLDPDSKSTTTATAYFHQNDILMKLLGISGSLSAPWELDGDQMITFTGTGEYLAPVQDNSTIVPDFSRLQNYHVFSTELAEATLHGTSMYGLSFNFDQSNTNELRSNTVERKIMYLDRKPTASLSVHHYDLATFDPWSVFDAQTKGPMVVTTGLNAGEIVEFGAPNVQIGIPALADKDKLTGIDFDLHLYPTPTGTDDEHYWEFK